MKADGFTDVNEFIDKNMTLGHIIALIFSVAYGIGFMVMILTIGMDTWLQCIAIPTILLGGYGLYFFVKGLWIFVLSAVWFEKWRRHPAKPDSPRPLQLWMISDEEEE